MQRIEPEKPNTGQHRTLHGELMGVSNLLRRSAESSGVKKKVDKVTNMHGFIIGFLYHNRDRDIFQKDIEEEFSYRRSTASAVVGLMEEKGLIERRSVPNDARLKKLILTERANEIAELVEDDVARVEKQMIKGIDEDELTLFFKVLDKIKHNLEEPYPTSEQIHLKEDTIQND